ncbi:hypothetical protein A1Q2_07090 [Trichosporon asahii var. asahii CBS 8904]|uniref:Uncharacterized protein n=2 Tax=Trichosporon asahii var. asahii TaxID=189963 RepID=K1WA95_TRIAC|nr:hypothetical protein A1Q1_07833 [Trichosporon asahii var. asahii CBS 2479]EJT50967.1 hypothetical protein A1Q1_07833 [Trichosporon asahii var. asahii CBS 2479]EKC98598.1 hypothetical protein A1Q2_07090 [Trichosporon asahii var. asahii CBS 8904]
MGNAIADLSTSPSSHPPSHQNTKTIPPTHRYNTLPDRDITSTPIKTNMGQLFSCFAWLFRRNKDADDTVDLQDDTAFAQTTGPRANALFRVSRRPNRHPFDPQRDVPPSSPHGITKVCTGRRFDGFNRGR